MNVPWGSEPILDGMVDLKSCLVVFPGRKTFLQTCLQGKEAGVSSFLACDFLEPRGVAGLKLLHWAGSWAVPRHLEMVP